MLKPGAPIPYWQVTPLEEAEYNVADMPMEGEMDSTFFLTKEKNFIPHTYPCRTAYIEERRDRALPAEEAPDWEGARNILPFGSPFADLSGFWFRATKVRGWARTSIEAETAGPARLRLGICGAARAYVNGQPVAWLSPATRNAMDEVDFDVDLVAGPNEVAIRFEDLAERDAVIRIALSWLDGPAARAGHTFPATAEVVSGVEAALEAMHLDRKVYDGEDIVLKLPVPFPAAVSGSIRVAGHFMSHDHDEVALAIAPGAEAVRLASSADFPADYRYFDFRLDCGGFTTEARLGAEVTWRSRTGPAPQDAQARIAETIHWIARHAETDTETALACADLGDPEALARAERILTTALPGIERCFDCADFALVPLLWTRMVYPDRLSPALLKRIDAAILDFRYWMDEPGNDVQWYFSENHALLFHTSAYLAGALLPEARFRRSGRLGAEQSRIGHDRLQAWFDHFEAAEMAEFNSATYFPIDLKGLSALYALAPDAGIRARAHRAITRLVTMVAHSAHHGVITGAQGRSYEHSLLVADTSELTGMARLLWGRGQFGAHVNCLAQMALALRDHALDLPDLTAIANWERPEAAQEWSFWQGENAFCRLYHYKTAETALGSTALYRWQDWGYQETLIQARIGRDPSASLFINHPGEIVQSGFGRPSFWGGSASVPRVQQYRDLAIVRFDGVAPQPDFTHAWFPAPVFDEWAVEGHRAQARAGRGALLLRASGPLELMRQGGSAGHELRLAGRQGLWVVRLGETQDLSGFAAAHPLEVAETTDGTFVIEDADYGPVQFRRDGKVIAEGRTLDPLAWTLAGHRQELPLKVTA
ncbi:hypothetical protein KM176_20125 [Pseudooceanicola sp. CBS1P-1]|uniref:Uncharacterized protein n=1 Tax=Pseudooceanicola albus TaxID=2692189 RepID=A0A6L7G735_9RHOB|nr:MULTISPECIES: hypothetical protein [Pseudooceanicola]MBT9386188.1 hypothetical protein [Pseudooceanicola endophyticus]MXN19397.1 hypothetical protein [Pseudooceanicola albus]